MIFQKVESSNLAALGYDASTKTLGVLFKAAGTLYFYSGVPSKIWDAFLKSESLGKFLNVTVKPSYDCFAVENLITLDTDPAPMSEGVLQDGV